MIKTLRQKKNKTKNNNKTYHTDVKHRHITHVNNSDICLHCFTDEYTLQMSPSYLYSKAQIVLCVQQLYHTHMPLMW